VTIAVLFSHQINSIISQCVDGDYYSNETDCGAFYQCSNGELIEQRCPGVLYFNPELNVCDYPENVECGGTIEPTTTRRSTTATTTTTITPNTTQERTSRATTIYLPTTQEITTRATTPGI